MNSVFGDAFGDLALSIGDAFQKVAGPLDHPLTDAVHGMAVHVMFHTPSNRVVTVVCDACVDERKGKHGRTLAAVLRGPVPARVSLHVPLFAWWEPIPGEAPLRRSRSGPIPSIDSTIELDCIHHGGALLSGHVLHAAIRLRQPRVPVSPIHP